MAQRTKRKLELDRDVSAPAPSIGGDRGEGGHSVTPTSETQELYDNMRRLEEEYESGTPSSLGAYLQAQNSKGSSDEHADQLQPPTPSQGAASPLSPSCASTTHSLNQAMDHMDVGDDEPRRKRLAIRHGPLHPYKRARAAFMRKVGACSECRSRRVQV